MILTMALRCFKMLTQVALLAMMNSRLAQHFQALVDRASLIWAQRSIPCEETQLTSADCSVWRVTLSCQAMDVLSSGVSDASWVMSNSE